MPRSRRHTSWRSHALLRRHVPRGPPVAPFTLCAATTSGNQHNNHYSHHQVTDAADLQAVAEHDHVAAIYVQVLRSIASFTDFNYVVMGINNDHTDIPAK